MEQCFRIRTFGWRQMNRRQRLNMQLRAAGHIRQRRAWRKPPTLLGPLLPPGADRAPLQLSGNDGFASWEWGQLQWDEFLKDDWQLTMRTLNFRQPLMVTKLVSRFSLSVGVDVFSFAEREAKAALMHEAERRGWILKAPAPFDPWAQELPWRTK